MEGFSVSTFLDVRYRDLDLWGHVNNAVYLSFLEVARVEYLKALSLNALERLCVVARLEIDYLRSVEYGQKVEVGIKVVRLGNKSFDWLYEIRADGLVAAKARSVQVWMAEGKSIPIPEEVREAVAGLEQMDR